MEETGSDPSPEPLVREGTMVYDTLSQDPSSTTSSSAILASVENPEAYDLEALAHDTLEGNALADEPLTDEDGLSESHSHNHDPYEISVAEDEIQQDLLARYSSETEDSEQDVLRVTRTPDTPLPERIRPIQFEIVLPELSEAERAEYRFVYSDMVDFILEETAGHSDDAQFRIEYTDGRQELVSELDLARQYGGRVALKRWRAGLTPKDIFEMGRSKAPKRYWDGPEDDSSGESPVDAMDFDEDEEPIQPRSKRQRTSPRTGTHHKTQITSDEEEEPELSKPRGRQLRQRQPRQLTLTKMAFASGNSFGNDEDELTLESFQHQSDGEDDDFQLITSDLAPKSRRGRKNLRRLKSSRLTNAAPGSRGSSIEFEEDRRRSGRSTRNTKTMTDTAMMDDESFYAEETMIAAAPKIISVKEIFKPIPPDSDFADFHVSVCEVCDQGPVSNKGQLIGCQGCSLSFHKGCIGYRAQREHMATKIGEDSFVLQCKWCIGIHKKKDTNAPRHEKCQSCREDGKSCNPFSEKKSSKQEEKLRQENGGVDPITTVEPSLINNPQNVMFRCSACKRGWHFEHLPSSRMQSDVADVREQRLADYSVDWKCEDCGLRNEKIHTLVAWRPTTKSAEAIGTGEAETNYEAMSEDDKEYLIKWADCSYFHCTWMPGAWVHGIAAGAMRTTFAKRNADKSLLKMDKKDAIPEEYLLADVVLYAKPDDRMSSKAAEMERISKVARIFVKFQGLGYDEAVWDSPPSPESGRPYEAFKEAYEEYLSGKYFAPGVGPKMQQRVKAWKAGEFVELKEQPRGIKRGKLMKYQEEGVNWMLSSYHTGRNVILADEMGLGKTVQVVSLITTLIQDSPKCWPFMVVVPNSTCPNWRREIKFWAPDLRVVTYHGGRKPQELAYKYELFPGGTREMKAHIVVMSYDSAQDDRTKSLFRSVSWAGLVVDEGQRLKNDQNLLYVALKAMSFPFRLLLTGTPLQNNKRELFNLLQFVDPAHNAAKMDEEYSELNATNLPELHEKIRPYFLRRTKAQVLKFLPPMAQIILPVSMTILQEKLCKSIMAKSPELIKAIFADDKIKKTKDRGSLNNILMQLRKCLCHPFIYSQAIEERSNDATEMQRNLISASAKLLLLEIMLPKLKERGHRVLLFSQFLNQLDIVEDYLIGRGYDFRRLDGSISSLEKQKRIDAFNAPDSPVFAFLLSTRAGGVGINLATADTVIILDPDFNPHQDIQALSRAHRIGQKNKVLCFQLMTKNSVEEKIMQIGRKKMALDHVLIEAMDNENDAGDDLESILKFGASALFSDEQDQKDIIRYDDASVDKLLDRTDMEQTKTNADGSAESQFSFAKVWANDKGGFEDDIAEHEDPTVNPSVWEDILAEREAEAQRLAEAEKVVLGRGGRRRTAVNYRTNEAIDAAGRADMSGSDVDGDFKADTDEEEESADDADAVPDTAVIDIAGGAPKTSNTIGKFELPDPYQTSPHEEASCSHIQVADVSPAQPSVPAKRKKIREPRNAADPQAGSVQAASAPASKVTKRVQADSNSKGRSKSKTAARPNSSQPATESTPLSNPTYVASYQGNIMSQRGIPTNPTSFVPFVPSNANTPNDNAALPSNGPMQAEFFQFQPYQNMRLHQPGQHHSPFFNFPPNHPQQVPQQPPHHPQQPAPRTLNGAGPVSYDSRHGHVQQLSSTGVHPNPPSAQGPAPQPNMGVEPTIPGLSLAQANLVSKQVRAQRKSQGKTLVKAVPPASLSSSKCAGCSGDHPTSNCKERLTEIQMRIALDDLARMPASSAVACEKMVLKQRLRTLAYQSAR